MTLSSLSRLTTVLEGGVEALGPITIDVQEGEFLGIVGPSGCGKTTLLRTLAGLQRPSTGDLTWSGNRPRTGFVFQDPTLMPWATATENVRLQLDLEGMRRELANQRANAALESVGLKDWGSKYPRQLSGGMRMRVSLARALVGDPQLLLLDEPFAALDEITRLELQKDIIQLWRDKRLTVVFVTHNVLEAILLSTRVVVLSPRPGRIASSIDVNPPDDRSKWRLTPAFERLVTKVSSDLRVAVDTANTPTRESRPR